MYDLGMDARLGTQLWLERDDNPERVVDLVRLATEVGFGQVRVFLMWPWVQDRPDQWDFSLFDQAFDAAATTGLKVKATLTANSGPWWLGTPSVLHSHTPLLSDDWTGPVTAYVEKCVTRYAGHPALGQWVIWNEPYYSFAYPGEQVVRPERARRTWVALLQERYGSVAELNRRWRTGFSTFDEAPLPEELAHPAHRANPWQSFGPLLDECRLRAILLEEDLRLIAETVRRYDPVTPLCINPSELLANHAAGGYRLAQLSCLVDVLGASFHAPWHFSFAPRDAHRALSVVGLSLVQATQGQRSCEVTEIQTGNTYYAGRLPLGASEGDVAASYLAPLLAGASSVTGWCFNTRHQDFEAGEWALLDDGDCLTERSLAVTRVGKALSQLDKVIGTWQPAPPEAAVFISEGSQAVALALAAANSEGPRGAGTAMQGSALLAVALERLGVHSALATLPGLLEMAPKFVLCSDVIAWGDDTAETLLELAARGATVLIDGTSGRFDPDARLHVPWPAGLAGQVGLYGRGLLTHPHGIGEGEVFLHGRYLGRLVGVRSDVAIEDPTWSCAGDLTFRHESRPLLWTRAWGAGSLAYCPGALARSTVELVEAGPVVAYILSRATTKLQRTIKPLSPNTFTLRVEGDNGNAIGVFSTDALQRDGEPFVVQVPAGDYEELWTGQTHYVGKDGLLALQNAEGIALLVCHDSGEPTGDSMR